MGVNRIVITALVMEKNQKYFRRRESFWIFIDCLWKENKYRDVCIEKKVIEECEIGKKKSVHTMWAKVGKM